MYIWDILLSYMRCQLSSCVIFAYFEKWDVTHSLSFAGRVHMVKSAIYEYFMYRLQSYKLPGSIITLLNKIMSNFIWKGKMQACSWESMCRPKSEKCLEIRKHQDINNVAGLKLFWRYFETNSGCRIFFQCAHKYNNNFSVKVNVI